MLRFQSYVAYVARSRLYCFQITRCSQCWVRQSSNYVRLRRRLFIFHRYHEFKIKGLVGTPFYVFPAHGNRDPFALNCVLPEVSEIPESLLDVPLVSKSSRKSYTLREVAGRHIGRGSTSLIGNSSTYWIVERFFASKGMLFIFQKSNITNNVNSWFSLTIFRKYPLCLLAHYMLKHDLSNGVTLIIYTVSICAWVLYQVELLYRTGCWFWK